MSDKMTAIKNLMREDLFKIEGINAIFNISDMEESIMEDNFAFKIDDSIINIHRDTQVEFVGLSNKMI